MRCPICKRNIGLKIDVIRHMNGRHYDVIPQNTSTAKYYYALTHNGETTGKCRICDEPTEFDEKTGRVKILCNNPKCKEQFAKIARENNMKKFGVPHLLNDQKHQMFMLSKRKISGEYQWSDSKAKISYVGSYEKRFLEFLDNALDFDPSTIYSPCPFDIYYEYEGEMLTHTPDFYIDILDLIIEIKHGGTNPNTHPKFQAVDIVKDKLKEKAIKEKTTHNYIKITDNNFNPFIKLMFHLVEDKQFDDKIRRFIINETDSPNLIIENNNIDFPSNEYSELRKRLSHGKPIYTTRVSTEMGRYNIGNTFITPWNDVVKVTWTKIGKYPEDHPFKDSITKEQWKIISKYDRYKIIKLEKIDTLKETTSPPINSIEELLYWMRSNVKYADFTKLMSADEVIQNKKGSCHDQVVLEDKIFTKLNIHHGRLFFIEYNDHEQQGGITHTLIYFKKNDKIYWFENAWNDQEGIHGPFNSLKELKDKIIELHKKMPSYQRYPKLHFNGVKNVKIGMSLGEYVAANIGIEESAILNEDFHAMSNSLRKPEGKSMKDINIKNDLEDLADKMDSFTEEEALVQLLSSYKRKGYDTHILMQFRDKNKNIIRWIRDKQLIIDPQLYINYDNNQLNDIGSKDIEKIKQRILNKTGKVPSRFGASMLNEANSNLSEDDIYYNFNKWFTENNNILLIIGYSGSGKSTLGRELAKEYDAIYLEQDMLIRRYSKKYPNIKDYKILNDKIINDFKIEFKNKKMVLEGLNLIYLGIDELRKYPLVIKNTGFITSTFRAIKRDLNNPWESHKDKNKILYLIDVIRNDISVNKKNTDKLNFIKDNMLNEVSISSFTQISTTKENIERLKKDYPRLNHVRVGDNLKGVIVLDGKKFVAVLQCDPDNGFIIALEVAAEYRGKGIAFALLNEAKRMGVYKLTVNKKNNSAISLYKKTGYNVYKQNKAMYYMSSKKPINEQQSLADLSPISTTTNPLVDNLYIHFFADEQSLNIGDVKFHITTKNTLDSLRELITYEDNKFRHLTIEEADLFIPDYLISYRYIGDEPIQRSIDKLRGMITDEKQLEAISFTGALSKVFSNIFMNNKYCNISDILSNPDLERLNIGE